jgi:outer membrane protein TolC
LRAISLACALACALPGLVPGTIFAAPAWQESPRAPVAPPLTGDALASMVLEANPGLAAAAAAAEAAAHRIEPAGSLEDPMLSYAVAPLTAGADRSLHQSIEVSQRIPWPGTLAARESAARYQAATAEQHLESLRLQIIARSKAAWAEWGYIDSALNVHHATRALLDDLLATARTRYAAGRSLRQDVLQAEVERAELERHQLRLLRERATIQARINALLNLAPDTPLPPAAPLTLQPPLPPLQALQTLALARHPELSRLQAQISASESQVTPAQKAFYPNFEIGAGYDAMWETVDQRPMISFSINVPFDRNKRRAELDRAGADLRRAEYTLSERRAELLAALATARADVAEARRSVALYENRLVPLAEQYLQAAIADYQSGAGAFLNVITAEQRKLGTGLELARTRADYARRLAELELWAGGSLDVSPGTPAGASR